MATKHLTDEQIREIYKRAKSGERQKAIAKDYPGLTINNVSEIKSGGICGYITGLKKATPIEELTKGEPVSDIPFYDGYFITRSGIVIGTQKGINQVMRQSIGTDGYCTLRLTVEDRCVTAYVHRLLCLAFKFDEYFEGAVVRHLDGNPKNNDLSNLQWGTQKENYQDAVRHNTSTHGEKNGSTTITTEQALEIKRLLAEGNLKQSEIARRFNISRNLVHAISVGRTWAWLETGMHT